MIVYLWMVAGIFWVIGIINLFAFFAFKKDFPKDRLVFLLIKASFWFIMSLIGFYFVTRV